MKTIPEIEQELLLKKQRISYWGKCDVVPSISDFALFNNTNMEVRL